MTDEEWVAMKEFIRAYSRLRTDSIILSAMLLKCEINQVPPQDWLAELRQMRDLPAHRAAHQDTEELLARVEQKRGDNRLTWLLKNLPKISDLIQ